MSKKPIRLERKQDKWQNLKEFCYKNFLAIWFAIVIIMIIVALWLCFQAVGPTYGYL